MCFLGVREGESESNSQKIVFYFFLVAFPNNSCLSDCSAFVQSMGFALHNLYNTPDHCCPRYILYSEDKYMNQNLLFSSTTFISRSNWCFKKDPTQSLRRYVTQFFSRRISVGNTILIVDSKCVIVMN